MMPLSENERRILAEIESDLEHPPRAGRQRLAAAVRAAAGVAAIVGTAALGGVLAVAQAPPPVAAGVTGVLGVVTSGCVVLAASRSARRALAWPYHRAVGRARRRRR